MTVGLGRRRGVRRGGRRRGSIRRLLLLLLSGRRRRRMHRRIRFPRNVGCENSAGRLHLDLRRRRRLRLRRMGVVVRLVRLRRFGKGRRRRSLHTRHPTGRRRLSLVSDLRWLRRRPTPPPFPLLLLLPLRLLLLVLRLGDVSLLLKRWRSSLLVMRRAGTRGRRHGVGLVEARIRLGVQMDLMVELRVGVWVRMAGNGVGWRASLLGEGLRRALGLEVGLLPLLLMRRSNTLYWVVMRLG